MKLSKLDYDDCMRILFDPTQKIPDNDRDALSYAAGMWAANEPIDKETYKTIKRYINKSFWD